MAAIEQQPQQTGTEVPTTGVPDEKDKNAIKTSNFGCIVKYLPLTYTSEQVQNLFSTYGKIVGVKLIKNHITGASQGYGFVYYEEQKAVDAAVAGLNGKQIDSKVIRVAVADQSKHQEVQRSNVYIAGIPKTYQKQDLDTLFGKFGRIVESRILVDNQGQPRGVGFVRYDSYQNAQTAITQMNNTVPPGGAENLIVRLARDNKEGASAPTPFLAPSGRGRGRGAPFAPPPSAGFGYGQMGYGAPQQDPYFARGQAKAAPQPFYNAPVQAPATPFGAYDQQNPYGMQYSGAQSYMPPQPGMPPQMASQMPMQMSAATPTMASGQTGSGDGVQLFVFHLPGEYKEDDLFKLFSHYGTVLSVKIITDPGSNLSRGYGFVNMASQQEATQAIYALNGFRLGNKYLKVEFKQAR